MYSFSWLYLYPIYFIFITFFLSFFVVDLLSSDDDSSPYSLLKGDEKIRDFNSPYQFPPSTQSSASPFFLNY